MLDEALELIRRLTSGEPVDHHGTYFTATDVTFQPAAAVPIWVAARWPNRRPLRRAASYDGVFVIDLQPPDLVEALRYIEPRRQTTNPFDVVVQVAPESDPRPWEDAGATWWLAAFDSFTVTPSTVRRVIDAGMPAGDGGHSTPRT